MAIDDPVYVYCKNCEETRAELVGKIVKDLKPYKFICRNCQVAFSSKVQVPIKPTPSIEDYMGPYGFDSGY